MRHSPLLGIRALVLALIVSAPTAAAVPPAQPPGEMDGAAIDRTLKDAERFVVRVGDGQRFGSAVFLEARVVNGQTYGYLATCFHVLYQTQAFRMEFADGKKVGPGAGAERFWADRENDLVIIRVPLEGSQAARGLFQPVGPAAAGARGPAARKTIPNAERPKVGALALGYPFFLKQWLREVKLRLGRTADAYQLNLPQVRTGSLVLRETGDEPTAAGMSGGPVLDADGRLAGLVVARVLDTAGFLIPAETVIGVLDKAIAKEAVIGTADDLPGFAAAKFGEWKEVPYDPQFVGKLHAAGDVIRDARTWQFASHWAELLQDKPGFREGFQEVVLDLSKFGAGAANPKARVQLRVEPASFHTGRADEPAAVRVWVNGKPQDRVPGPKVDPVTFERELELVPGQNLITLSRKSGDEAAAIVRGAAGNAGADPGAAGPGRMRLNLNRLTESAPLRVSLVVDGEAVYTIHRELPALFDSYSVFLTLVNGPPATVGGGYNVTVALNLAKVSALLNAFPVVYHGALRDDPGLSRVEVTVATPGTKLPNAPAAPAGPFATLSAASDQSVRVHLAARTQFSNLRMQRWGIALERKGASSSDVELDGIVQFLRTADGHRAAARFVGGWIKEFPFAIGAGISADVRSPIADLLVAQLNDRVGDNPAVHSESGEALDSALVRKVLDLVRPGLIPAGASAPPIAVRAIRVDPAGWVVLGLLVGEVPKDRQGELQTGPPANPATAKDATPADLDALAVIDARGVPAAAARVLLPNPALAAAAASTATVGARVRIGLELPSEPQKEIEVHQGDLRAWSAALVDALGKGIKVDGTAVVEVDAAALRSAVSSHLDGVKVSPEGAASGTVKGAWAAGAVSWSIGRGPVLVEAKSVAIGKPTLDDVKLSVTDMSLPAGAAGSAGGTVSVGGLANADLPIPGLSVSKLGATYKLRFDPGEPGVVHVDLSELVATLQGPDLPVVGRASVDVRGRSGELTIRDRRVTGEVVIGGAGDHVKLTFGANGLRVGVESKTVTDAVGAAERKAKEAAENAKREAEELAAKAKREAAEAARKAKEGLDRFKKKFRSSWRCFANETA